MSWAINRKRVLQFALLTCAAGELSAAAAELLVLRSLGPSASRAYKPGNRYSDDKVFELKAGDTLVVLGAGGTRNWRGPGYYSLVQPSRPYRLASGQVVRIATGGVRRVPPEPGVNPTELSEYDISRSGTLCVASGAQPVLWRPRKAAAARVTITATTGATHSFDWPAGASGMAWPAALGLADGESYFIQFSGARETVRIKVRRLAEPASASSDLLAAALVRDGCLAQLDTLIATRADAGASATPAAAGNARQSR